MAATLLEIHPDNPDKRKIEQVAKALEEGAVVIYPTDTIYAMGCSIKHPKAVERLAAIKGLKVEKANFSIMCADLSHLADYTKPISQSHFRLLKRLLPGPYTFIFESNNKIPKTLNPKKKTIGIRVPDNKICMALSAIVGQPIITTSLKEDSLVEYPTDPEAIFEAYKNLVDIVIDGGMGNIIASTVLDCSGDGIEVVREGAGSIEGLLAN